MSDLLYEMTGVSFAYPGGGKVLDSCDFVLHRGDFLGLIGPNGAGKSTLMYLLTRWLEPQGGAIALDGKPLARWARRDIARRVAIVPQHESAAFSYSVEEVVLMGRYAHQSAPFGFESEEDHEVAAIAIRQVGLGGFERRRADELSGGEYQRMLIARALAQQTGAIFLDEPTASLDLAHQRQVFQLLEKLNGENRVTLLIISHDVNLAALYCRELALLHAGRLEERGSPREVLREATLARLYNAPVSVGEGPDGRVAVWIRK